MITLAFSEEKDVGMRGDGVVVMLVLLIVSFILGYSLGFEEE